jgi:ketosteroid isomerase-like protein
MKRNGAAIFLLILLAAFGHAQPTRPGTACRFAGAYRISVADSDRLYTAVQDATSSVPFREQQRFFMDLSVRLTPPDLLALECAGNRVSVGSSRAERVTFTADGRQRQERAVDGGLIYSRISMTPDTLIFSSTGKAEDNLNVTFRSTDNGRRLRVTRRIYAEQLSQPVVINSVYDKLSDRVDWGMYGQRQVASTPADEPVQSGAPRSRRNSPRDTGNGSAARELRRALDEWIAATNRRDIERQMAFYAPTLQAFYLTRNTPRSGVRAEKQRAFSTARDIDIQAAEPEIVFQESGRVAVMRFRKQYRIVDRSRTRSGEVVQELRWRHGPNGWRIFSERDVKVVR